MLVESSTPHESEDYKGSAISLDTSLPVWGYRKSAEREESSDNPLRSRFGSTRTSLLVRDELSHENSRQRYGWSVVTADSVTFFR